MILAAALAMAQAGDTFVVTGDQGPGRGKHVVLLAGDEEYRSEEMLPQLAKILAKRHGFKCTVVFSQNAQGHIDPTATTRQPGIEALKTADVCVMMLRFRRWEDAAMQHFVDYYLAGKPIIGIRTSTHAFDYPPDSVSDYRKYSWQSKDWPGGFGKQVLGETWLTHWGNHGAQATRGKVVADHPVLRGVSGLFGTTDVYEAHPPADAEILVRGEVVEGMLPGSATATNRKRTVTGAEQLVNEPMMPIVWVRNPVNAAGQHNRILTSTMGAATDFENAGFRRLLVNGVFWTTNIPVPSNAEVGLIGDYKPSNFGFNGFRRGVAPRDLSATY